MEGLKGILLRGFWCRRQHVNTTATATTIAMKYSGSILSPSGSGWSFSFPSSSSPLSLIPLMHDQRFASRRLLKHGICLCNDDEVSREQAKQKVAWKNDTRFHDVSWVSFGKLNSENGRTIQLVSKNLRYSHFPLNPSVLRWGSLKRYQTGTHETCPLTRCWSRLI